MVPPTGAKGLNLAASDAQILAKAALTAFCKRGGSDLLDQYSETALRRIWKSVVTSMVHVTDMYTTLLKIAEGKVDQPKKPDGLDVWAAITGSAVNPRREMLINVEDFRGAIRVREWKLIARAALPTRMELFNVANDPEETANRADAYPDR